MIATVGIKAAPRWAGRLLLASLCAALSIALARPGLAHDPETFLKGKERISKGYSNGGNVEAKRAANTGKGMPSIRGPFPEDSFGLDFIGQLTNAELGVTRLAGTGAPFLSDIWGWTDRTGGACNGDEYALVGTSSGLAFARITDADDIQARDTPVFLGIVPTTNPNTLLNFWWDVKVFADKAYWTTEVLDQGLAVFDLKRLCALAAAPEGGVLEADSYIDITLGDETYRSAHNISVNERTGRAYLTGVRSDLRLVSPDPMWIVDLNSLSEQTPEGLAGVALIDAGEPTERAIDSHDAQIVIYEGPDQAHKSREIALVAAGLNEEIAIFDVTDSDAITQISSISYPGASFTHQGWLDETHSFFFLGDEEDELFGISDPRNPDLPDTTRTYVFDVRDLDNPTLHCFFDAPYAAIDHNMFVKGTKLYQANYTSGFTVWDFSGMDPALGNCGMVELGHMDTEPRLPNIHMNHNINIFVGPWGIYPFFDSGKIIVSDGLNGLIVAKLSD